MPTGSKTLTKVRGVESSKVEKGTDEESKGQGDEVVLGIVCNGIDALVP